MQQKTNERRDAPRTKISGFVRIRPSDPRYPAEVGTTSNVSPNGLYFLTSAGHYLPGMEVHVIRNFQPGASTEAEEVGAIVRIDRLESGQSGVAIHVFSSQDSTAR